MAGCLATGAGGCRTGDWLADRTGLEVPEAVILVFIARGGIPDLPPRVRLRKFQALIKDCLHGNVHNFVNVLLTLNLT